MTRHVTVVVASLSAFILAQAAHEKVEGGLAQEQASARAAPALSGHELASRKSSAQITALVALADERATQVKSDSLATTVSTRGARPAALSEIHAGSTRATTSGTTSGTTGGTIGGRTVGVVVRSAKHGAGSCIVFNNQADFEAFNAEEGKVFKGIEDFEETPPGTGIVGMPDPLCGGIPNPPFMNGLDQLNLCVQSNFEHTWANPNPRGYNALVFVPWCDLHRCSDVVVANTFVDSLDVMLISPPVLPGEEDDHTGVGFNPVAFMGTGPSADIRVFDKNNILMVITNTPADPAGSNFWGVWCADTIGRINIFDPGNGAEGGDNIQMWVTPGKPDCGDDTCDPNEDCESCPDDCGQCPSCVTFNSQAEFEAFNAAEGNVLKGIEDFEEGPPGAGMPGPHDPLCGGIPNGWPFFNGLDQLNLCVQSNLLGGAPDVPAPRGENALVFVEFGSGFGESSDLVLANTFVDSIDVMLISPPVLPGEEDDHTGVGFDTVSIFGGGFVDIRVYDKNNAQMVSATSPADPAGSNFWGVWCADTIGRINIFDPGNGAEGGDNIQMWVEGDPCGECPTDVDGSGDTGAADLAVLLGFWGPCAPGDPCECLDADDDGLLGPADLAVLLGAWGLCP